MRNKMTVRVTKKDIKYGRRFVPESCAIALALKDKGFTKVAVGATINVVKKGRTGIYDIPARAETFIENFDSDKKSVKPCTFRLKLRTKFGWNDKDKDGFLKREDWDL